MVRMYKRKTIGGRKRGPKRGRGIGSFFSKVWRGIKSVAKPINDIAKKTKIVSTVVAPMLAARNPAAGAALSGASQSLGYGRRRRVRRVRRTKVGGSLFTKLRAAVSAVKPYARRLNSHLKSSKWLSTELKNKNYPTASKLVSALGYGKSRKRVTRRKRRVGVKKGSGSGAIGNAIKSNRSVIKF